MRSVMDPIVSQILLLSQGYCTESTIENHPCRSESDEDINRDYHGFYEFTFRRFFDDGHPGTISNFDTNFSNSFCKAVWYNQTSHPFYFWFVLESTFSSSSLLNIFSLSVYNSGAQSSSNTRITDDNENPSGPVYV